MDIIPIDGKVFGATVTGVDLRAIDDEQTAAITAALLEHGFLVFPDQHLDEAASIAFGERFGELEFGGMAMSNVRKAHGAALAGGDEEPGDVLDLESQMMRTNIGNEAWHTDSTYKPVSSKCAMLSAVVVPDEGGQTELADTRAGYAALDQATKDRIDGLSAYHSTQYSQANDVGDFPTQDTKSIYHGEAYLRPIVKVHPETGVKNLFIGRHAFGIPGLRRAESQELLRHLLEVVVADESRVYRHEWTAGDLLLWDNRALLHRAMPYDYSKPRVLIGTRVAGDESELSYYPDDPEAEAGRQALAAELELLRDEVADRRYGATTAAVGIGSYGND